MPFHLKANSEINYASTINVAVFVLINFFSTSRCRQCSNGTFFDVFLFSKYLNEFSFFPTSILTYSLKFPIISYKNNFTTSSFKCFERSMTEDRSEKSCKSKTPRFEIISCAVSHSLLILMNYNEQIDCKLSHFISTMTCEKVLRL